MNKKYVKYSVLAMLLMVCKPSFSMKTLIVRGLQGAAAAYCIGKGAKEAYELNDLMKFPVYGPSVPKKIEEWGQGVLREVNIPNASSIPFKLHDIDYDQDMASQFVSQEWGCEADKGFRVPIYCAIDLKDSLDEESIKADVIVATNKIILMHEAGHYVNKDCKKHKNAFVWIPLATQAVSSTINCIFNSTFKRQMPKTLHGAMLRGSLAVGMVIPKLLINEACLRVSNRGRENGADDFARNNAKTRLELQLYENMFQDAAYSFEDNLKNVPEKLHPYKPKSVPNIVSWGYVVCAEKGLQKISHQLHDLQISEGKKKKLINIAHAIVQPSHPYFEDRADNTKKYLDKWDAEHPVDEHTT